MSYINCALCPAQALPTAEFVYFGYLVEFKCVSGHKTYVEKEKIDGGRVLAEPGEVTGHCF